MSTYRSTNGSSRGLESKKKTNASEQSAENAGTIESNPSAADFSLLGNRMF